MKPKELTVFRAGRWGEGVIVMNPFHSQQEKLGLERNYLPKISPSVKWKMRNEVTFTFSLWGSLHYPTLLFCR